MKTLNKFLNESNEIPEVVVATDSTIHDLVRDGIKQYGKDANLNYIDTSQVTNMDSLFVDTDFNGDIRHWDVSNVTNMKRMFGFCEKFNSPLNKWDVSNVTDFSATFFYCENFNQPLDK